MLERLVGGWRGHRGVELLARGSAARGALRALKQGRFLAMPFDQNCPRQEGVFVPFFGRLACTRDGPVRIAMRTGAPVLPVFIQRVGESERHQVRIEPPLALLGAQETEDPREAVVENARRMTEVIEAAIRRAPTEWTWTHRRWRTAPAGVLRPYPSVSTRRRPVIAV